MQSNTEPEKSVSAQPIPTEVSPPVVPPKEVPITKFSATWRNRAFKLPDLLSYLKGCACVWLTVTPNGITFSGHQDKGIFFIQIELSPDDCSSFNCEGTGPLDIPLNILNLYKKVKAFAEEKDTIQFILDADLIQKQRLNLVAHGISFEEAWAEEDRTPPKLTGFDFKAAGQLYITDLIEILTLAQIAGHETISFKATPPKTLCVYQSDCSREITLKNAVIEKPTESIYTIGYLLPLLKFTKSKPLLGRTRIQLKFATDHPIYFTIPLTSSSQINVFMAQCKEEPAEEEEEEDEPEEPAAEEASPSDEEAEAEAEHKES